MKNGFDIVFGIFNVLNHFDQMASNWRRRGYAYKIFSFVGLLLLGGLTVGFVAATYGCFAQAGKGIGQAIVFGIFGVICGICAIYCVFYFFVETISLAIIISILVANQVAYQKEQAESFQHQKQMEEQAVNAEISVQEGTAPAPKMQFDAHDQYQKEKFDELVPIKRPRRLRFRDRVKTENNEAYLKTKIGFDITIMVFTYLLMFGSIALTVLFCANIK